MDCCCVAGWRLPGEITDTAVVSGLGCSRTGSRRIFRGKRVSSRIIFLTQMKTKGSVEGTAAVLHRDRGGAFTAVR